MKQPALPASQVAKPHLGDRRGIKTPDCKTFKEFLLEHARVLQRDGSGGKFSMAGRAPLELIVDWLDKILRNTIGSGGSGLGSGEVVEIDGVEFSPGKLKGATLAVGGGAQFGKTILELNLMAYCTAIRFISVGNYLPDRPKVEEIVGQKFRPNVLDLYPWMADMIQLGKTQNASGKTIDRKESFTVTDGVRKSFGNFCGMHKPPTSITIDLAELDEVDDIPDRNIGYVDARMTNSPVHLTMFIGTQRVAGAGQNARLAASSYHVKLHTCPGCGKEWNLEENFPRIIRVVFRTSRKTGAGARAGVSSGADETTREARVLPDPILTAEMGHDRNAHYYTGCPECGAELDRDGGRFVAKHPERIKEAKFGVRVSQFTISAISLQEIVGSWFAAMADPSGEAMQAFYCDRVGIPNAGVAQPITQAVLDRARSLDKYAMSLSDGRRAEAPLGPVGGAPTGTRGGACAPRFAGMDMGPRCWFWCDEVCQTDEPTSALVWAELIASGNAPARVPVLMDALGIQCLFLDAGGEPDLTKRLVLALNGLENYTPPPLPRNELLRSTLSNLGLGISWDGERGQWQGLRAAAVLFVAGEAKGIEQTMGFTQDGKLYPLIKCNRGESIQTAVNDFLTPAEGILELLGNSAREARADTRKMRVLPRVRLPQTCIGAGVSQAVLDGHLLNLRKERDVKTGAEDWADGVENHLGLAKCYARLAVMAGNRRTTTFRFAAIKNNPSPKLGRMGLGRLNLKVALA